MKEKCEVGAPQQSSAGNEEINSQNEPNKAPPQAEPGAPPQLVKRIVKRASKSKTVVLAKGLSSVKIEKEKSREGRKSWRVTYIEDGKECSEMHGTYDDAHTAAEAKLNQLADGQRTLTRQELNDLFVFKLLVEQFDQRLAASKRTLEQVVSDAMAAAETLPAWTASQMAQFIVENHGVKNPMLVKDVIKSFIEHVESGYKRNYSKGYVRNIKLNLDRFEAAFGSRRIDLIGPEEALNFIKNTRAKPKKATDPSDVGEDGLVPASPKTKNVLFYILNHMFEYAKAILNALPARLKSVMQMLEAPEFTVPTPQIYTYREIVTLYALMPDLECILFVSLQLFAGLRPCECKRIRKKDIKRDAEGKLLCIFIRQEVGKKSPVTGRHRIRARKAPITLPLAALLNFMELQDGRLFASLDTDRRAKWAARAGKFVWKNDGLRHSFISYRLEDLKDRAQVAYEAGHGVDVQMKHYEGLIEDLADVAKYWSFAVPLNLPKTLNHQIVGQSFVRAHKKAKAEAMQNVVPLPKVA